METLEVVSMKAIEKAVKVKVEVLDSLLDWGCLYAAVGVGRGCGSNITIADVPNGTVS